MRLIQNYVLFKFMLLISALKYNIEIQKIIYKKIADIYFKVNYFALRLPHTPRPTDGSRPEV
jgi:hypothetical protein